MRMGPPVVLLILFVGTTALHPAPSVLLRPAAAGPRLQATILLQHEPGIGGDGDKCLNEVFRPRWPPREAWIALLACQATLLAAAFGWMVAFAPEQLRVDAELRRTACVQVPLRPLRGACLPIQPLRLRGGLAPHVPLRLRGGFAPHHRRRTALTAAALSLSLSLSLSRALAPAKAASSPSPGPNSSGATTPSTMPFTPPPPPPLPAVPPAVPPASLPATLPASLPASLPATLPATRTPAELLRGPSSAGPNSNGAMEERYTLGLEPFTNEYPDPDPEPSLPIFPILGAQVGA